MGDFVEGWVWVWLDEFLLKGGWLGVGVGVARRRRRVCEFVVERRGKEIIKKCKKNEYFIE